MPESYFSLAPGDRVEAIAAAASQSGRPMHILEKDVWVVWSLHALFSAPFAAHLVFKGGTSLSKVYKAIERFSEDIDVTYDIRQLVPELIGSQAGEHPVPATKSQGRKWTQAVRDELPAWIASTVQPYLQARLEQEQLEAKASIDPDDTECVFIEYASPSTGYGYIAPRVKIEFGARSTGEPAKKQSVTCDASAHLKDLVFPAATARVMLVERTFWEKITAVHVFCRQADIKERLARHWYDIAQLHVTGHSQAALLRNDLAEHAAEHKRWFFAKKDANGEWIDYGQAIQGGLVLVPEGKARDSFSKDYGKMVADGLFHGQAPSEDWVLQKAGEVQVLANERAK